MADWKKYKLGDLIEFIIDNRGKTPPLVDNGYEIIETNAINGKNKYPDYSKISKFVDEDTFKTWFRKGHPKINDILISTVGDIGKVSIMNKDRGCIAQNLIAIRCKKELLNPEFLYYFLILNKTQDILKNLNIGSVQPSLKVPHLLNIDIYIPNIIEQIKLVDVLSKLDEKIILNQETNQTLEAIAQAIFKSWFVDFDPVRAKAAALSEGKSEHEANLAAISVICGKDTSELNDTEYKALWQIAEAFPSEFVANEEFGEVPKGWGVSTIGECYDVIMGQSPSGETYNEQGTGTLFYQGRAEFGWRFPTPRLFTTEPKRMAKANDILMSVRAPVGDLNVALENCCIGRGLCALSHKSGEFSFGFYQMKNLKSVLDVFNSEGTVFGSINQKDLKSIPVLNPHQEIIALFNKFIFDIDNEIKNNVKENQQLEKTRDLLLPKLLSGEIHL